MMFQNYIWKLLTFFSLTVSRTQQAPSDYVCIRENCYLTTDRVNFTILENIRYLDILKKPTKISPSIFVKLRDLKQVNLPHRTFFRVCSHYDTFEESKWDQFIISPYLRIRAAPLYKNGFEECLKTYCQGIFTFPTVIYNRGTVLESARENSKISSCFVLWEP